MESCAITHHAKAKIWGEEHRIDDRVYRYLLLEQKRSKSVAITYRFNCYNSNSNYTFEIANTIFFIDIKSFMPFCDCEIVEIASQPFSTCDGLISKGDLQARQLIISRANPSSKDR